MNGGAFALARVLHLRGIYPAPQMSLARVRAFAIAWGSSCFGNVQMGELPAGEHSSPLQVNLILWSGWGRGGRSQFAERIDAERSEESPAACGSRFRLWRKHYGTAQSFPIQRQEKL